MSVMTLTDSAGVKLEASSEADFGSVFLGVEGWTGGVNVRTGKEDRLTNGTIRGAVFRTGRELTLTGLQDCDSREEAVQFERVLSGLFPPTERGDLYGTLRITHGPSVNDWLECEVALDGTVKPTIDLNRLGGRDGRVVNWEIPVYAPLPYLYGPVKQYQIQPVGSGIGLRYPLFSGSPGGEQVLNFGEAVNTQATLTNDGNCEAYPVFTVTVDDGSGFRLSDGNNAVEFIGSCSRSVPVMVDMRGAVTVNGIDRTTQASQRDWFSIKSRGSINVWLETLQGGSGGALAAIRDTWI